MRGMGKEGDGCNVKRKCGSVEAKSVIQNKHKSNTHKKHNCVKKKKKRMTKLNGTAR